MTSIGLGNHVLDRFRHINGADRALGENPFKHSTFPAIHHVTMETVAGSILRGLQKSAVIVQGC